MIKFYENGKAFLEDNLEILNKFPLDTSFFLVNSKSIHTFNRRNYCFKVIDNSSYLLVMRLDDYNLILFGDKNLVKEAVNTLKGKGPKDLIDLCLEAGSIMLVQAKLYESKEEALKDLIEVLNNGKAFEKLKEFIKYQGGDITYLDDLDKINENHKFIKRR